MALLEEALHFREFLRRGALEGEDRLLLVADRKHRPPGRARARASEELGRQGGDDAPLLGGSVLRLVDEQMVEPVVELVHDPGGARPLHQGERKRDLVVEVERAALGLGFGEGRKDRLGDGEQGRAALNRLGRATPVAQGDQAVLLAMEVFLEGRKVSAQVFRRQVTILTAARLALLRKEGVEQSVYASSRVGFIIRCAKLGCAFLVLRLADIEGLRPGLATLAQNVAAEHLRLDCRRGCARRQAEPGAQGGGERRRVVEGCERLRMTLRLADQLLEVEGAGFARDEVERLGGLGVGFQGGERAVARLLDQLPGLAFVDHLEVRRDIGLEWEELQKPLAEGVQGLDLEPARRLDRAGEQLSRELELGRTGLPGAALDDRRGQRLVIEARPVGQRLENAARHVGGGGLGEGEAEDLRRRRALEQEPQDALGQDVGLAAACVSRDPGGSRRVRRRRLRSAQRFGNDERAAHGAASAVVSPSPAAADHSLTRAKWS